MFATARSAASSAASGSKVPIRRMPISEAVSALRTGEASIPLSSDVKSLRIRYVSRDAHQGSSDFMTRFAPQLAYANPSIPFAIERIPDPRHPSKKPIVQENKAERWDGKNVPPTEVTVGFHTRPSETRRHTDSDAPRILRELLEVAGNQRLSIEGSAQVLIEGPTDPERIGTEEASAAMESAAGPSAEGELAGVRAENDAPHLHTAS